MSVVYPNQRSRTYRLARLIRPTRPLWEPGPKVVVGIPEGVGAQAPAGLLDPAHACQTYMYHGTNCNCTPYVPTRTIVKV